MRPRWSVLLAIATLPAIASCDMFAPDHCLTVEGEFDSRAPELMIDFREGVDVVAMSDTLAARYGFTPIFVADWSTMITIPAPQPPTVLSGLRCEPSIKIIEYDAVTQVASRR